MKIGLFDSGLGGLIVTHSLIQTMPEYDYVYLGDTARVPYGNRSQEVIYDFTKNAVAYLCEQDCQLIIIACNTASAEALRKLQQEYMPAHYPDRKVLGVLVPAAEEVVAHTKNNRVGIIATAGTVSSGTYITEIQKRNPQIKVTQQAAPLLVPLVENNALKYAEPILDDYLAPLLKAGIDTLVLGCTHYPFLKQLIRHRVGEVAIISQDEVVPKKLRDYLARHPEITAKLTTDSSRAFLTTDVAPSTKEVATLLFGEAIDLQKVSL